MDNDRRSRKRVPISVELKLHAPSLHFVLLSRTVDMSTRGAFVRSNRPLPVGAPVTVEFDRGRAKNPLRVSAEVVRVGSVEEGRAAGIALRFTDVTELDEALIDDLIRTAKA